ncbi:Permease YjgP/YjgQ family protein [Elusimicrobium minutum Pei191]|uniref:Permease YjgP/YjgQ family protein n=1 Tax=Elusimicrobium minutum (strain Pei191) TaxID=445932 RepID=B2KAY2_ELUMP|nr:LptF/LptG family permease [Elusimicrobium minutum]ACC97678.1 Permease YjgP/YjgQ family protein [Elusimicrobium minutum Pei191]
MENKIEKIKPKILYRYIASKFWMPFFFAMAMFCILVLLGDFFENIKSITNGYATFRLILKYCFLNLPSWLGMLLPVACLLAVLFVISDMVAGGEWTACLASGYRPGQLFVPLIACVILVVFLNSLMQEFVYPRVSQKAEQVFRRQLRGDKDFQAGIERNITLRINPRQMLLAQTLQSGSLTMYGITTEFYNENWEIEKQIVARNLVWDKDEKIWFYKDGVIRYFEEGITIREEVFDTLESDLKVAPKDISVGDIEEKAISVRELLKKISFLGRSGLVTYKEKTNLHNKLAMPVMTIIMCLIGMPFAVTVRKRGKVINIIAALVMSFSFWWVMTMASTAGQNGILSPFIAGWGIVVLAAAAVFIEFKIMKI